eukprot:364814-Chlamydomonas_euryale.AAC.6
MQLHLSARSLDPIFTRLPATRTHGLWLAVNGGPFAATAAKLPVSRKAWPGLAPTVRTHCTLPQSRYVS